MTASAGLLVYRRRRGIEVLLAHPGGPYWAGKDDGTWTIPKGELDGDEPLEAARREFEEETGAPPPSGALIDLGTIVQKSGKTVYAWAVEGDYDPAELRSDLFEMEWPPRSGRTQSFPEIDRFEWFDATIARLKVNRAQAELIDRLEQAL
jgi:predicted NUDIX family NTP pyrophosphohydrolase